MNCLLKDELQYELSVQGISSDSDVQTLCKLFRSVVAEKVSVDLRNLCTQCGRTLLMCCEQDIGVAGPDYEREVWIGPAHAALPYRTLSSEGTLAAFDADGPSVSGISTSKYQVRDRLHSIEINLAKMDMTDRPGQEKEEDDTSNTIIILWLCWNIFGSG